MAMAVATHTADGAAGVADGAADGADGVAGKPFSHSGAHAT